MFRIHITFASLRQTTPRTSPKPQHQQRCWKDDPDKEKERQAQFKKWTKDLENKIGESVKVIVTPP